MKMKLLILLSQLIFLNFLQFNAARAAIAVLPEPQELQEIDTIFLLNPETEIIFKNDPDSSASLVTAVINQTLRLHKYPEISISEKRFYRKKNVIEFHLTEGIPHFELGQRKQRIKWHAKMDDEGYVLVVKSERIDIYGLNTCGLYYGALTLAQLFQFYGAQVVVPGVIIRDWPRIKMRGITEDISRGQVPTLESFKHQIRFLSKCKMNTYMIYLEDMFAFEKYPSFGQNRGALTRAEVVEIQKFASRYHVEVVPIFQTLGHCENILLQPEFAAFGEFPGAATLNCTNPETHQFLENLIDEIVPVFQSSFFHIGGDECWDVGKGVNKNLRHQNGMAYLLGIHFNKVYSMLKKHNKKVIIYGDMINHYPQLLKRLPHDVIILDWQYHKSNYYRSLELFQNAGRKVIVSPGLSNWRRIYPNYHDSFYNIRNFIRQGQDAGALGAVVASWGDYGGENLHELNWYGFAFAAECAWNNHKTNRSDYNDKFFNQFYGCALPELDSTYFHLAELGAIADVADFWRYPFRNQIENKRTLLTQIYHLQQHSRKVLKLIPVLSRKIRKNHDHLHYLVFIARRGLLLGRKLQYSHEINQLSQQLAREPGNQRIKNTIIAMCSAMIHEFQQLQAEYQHLWLLTNKRQNLQNILELYHRQIFYWKQKIEQINAGEYNLSGEIRSRWIYHPLVRRDSTARSHVQFIKKIVLPENVKNFKFQTIGQSHLKIYFNSHFIGEQVARRSVSLIVEKQRVRIWDVTPYLKTGRNEITIEVKNYDRNEFAGLNFYGEISFFGEKKILPILSDDSWYVNCDFPEYWMLGNRQESCLESAICLPSKYFITQPEISKGFPSALEWR